MIQVKFVLPDGSIYPKEGISEGIIKRIPVLAARLREDTLFPFKKDEINKVEVKIDGVCKQDMIDYLRYLALQEKLAEIKKEFTRTNTWDCNILAIAGQPCRDGILEPHTHSSKYLDRAADKPVHEIEDKLEKCRFTAGMVRLCHFFMDEATPKWFLYKYRRDQVDFGAWALIDIVDEIVDEYIEGIDKPHTYLKGYHRTVTIVENFTQRIPELAKFIWENAESRSTIINILHIPMYKHKRFLNAKFEHLLPLATGEMNPGNGYEKKMEALKKVKTDPRYVGLKRSLAKQYSTSRDGTRYSIEEMRDMNWRFEENLNSDPRLKSLEEELVKKYMS